MGGKKRRTRPSNGVDRVDKKTKPMSGKSAGNGRKRNSKTRHWAVGFVTILEDPYERAMSVRT
jgi:hypothetical protein